MYVHTRERKAEGVGGPIDPTRDSSGRCEKKEKK